MFYYDEWGIAFEAMKQESRTDADRTVFIDLDDINETIGLREKQCEQKPIKDFKIKEDDYDL